MTAYPVLRVGDRVRVRWSCIYGEVLSVPAGSMRYRDRYTVLFDVLDETGRPGRNYYREDIVFVSRVSEVREVSA